MLTGEIILLDYSDTIIKPAYDELPKASYPLITVQEIENVENTRFSDNVGTIEHVSNNGYQIDIMSRRRKEFEATESVLFMRSVVNDLLGGPRYKMTRIDNPLTQPLSEDRTVLRAIARYICSIDLDENTIYKRNY